MSTNQHPLAGAIDRALERLFPDWGRVSGHAARSVILAEIEAEWGSITVEHEHRLRACRDRLVSDGRAES